MSITKTPKPDLTEHEEEAVPFDEVMRKIVEGKPSLETLAQPQMTKGREAKCPADPRTRIIQSPLLKL